MTDGAGTGEGTGQDAGPVSGKGTGQGARHGTGHGTGHGEGRGTGHGTGHGEGRGTGHDMGHDTGQGDSRAAAAVFHDGGCPVCRREIGWYRGMAGAEAVEWVDVAADPPSGNLPEGHDRASLLRRFTIQRRDGAVVDGAQGFVALWRALGPTRLLGRALDRWPLVQVAEIGYRLFLRVRMLWRPAR